MKCFSPGAMPGRSATHYDFAAAPVNYPEMVQSRTLQTEKSRGKK
jgi:hypothetical protein